MISEPLPRPLQILYVEDNQDDAVIISAYLRRAGYAPVVERVETAAGMAAALASRSWDLVLADFTVPGFGALSALQVLRDSGQELPFIIVSGNIQEEDAVAALRAGAHDFIVKDRLARLVPAIERELRDAHNRALQRREHAARQELEAGFQLLFANSPLPMWMYDRQTLAFVEVNEAACRTYGYSREEFLRMRIVDIRPPEDQPRLIEQLAQPQGAFRPSQLWRHVWKDGRVREVELAAHSLQIGARALTLVVVHDITERKQAEEGLRTSEARYRHIFETAGVAMWEVDYARLKTALGELPAQGVTDVPAYVRTHADFVQQQAKFVRVVDVNAATLRMLRAHSKAQVIDSLDGELSAEQLRLRLEQFEAIAEGKTYYETETIARTFDGQLRDVFLTMTIPTEPEQFSSVLVSLTDITEGKRRRRELEAMAAVSAALRTTHTLNELLTTWLDITLASMNATGGSIWLHDAVKDELYPAVIRGWTQPAGAEPVQPQKPGVGVNGHVFITRRPYVSANFALDPHLAEGTRERIPPGGGAGIPIPVGDEIIGTFIVNRPVDHPVTPDEVHLLTTLAEIAGSAIHRTRLGDQTEQRLGQLSALRAVDQAITASLDLNLTLTVLLEQVVTQLGIDAADVLLVEPSEQLLRYAAGRGFRTREFQQVRVRFGEGRAGRAVLERKIIVSDMHDVHPASRRTGQLGGEGFVSYVGVPLIAKGQVLGALEIFHRSQLDPAPEWMSFLSALAGQAALALDNAALFDNLQRSNTNLQLAYDATIEGWSRALDLRDKETEGHSQRVTRLTKLLAAALDVPERQTQSLRWGALLHDIGKMGVPDYILLKPGPLTDDEWTIMRQHPSLAYQMLSPIHYLRQALEIPYCHHEKWDGTGYPRGLRGEVIPLPARLFAVVDVWDALCSDRPYRRAWPPEKARDYIRAQAGLHFDPAVVEAFLQLALF